MATTAHNNAEDEISQLNYIQDSELFLQQKPYEILSEAPPGTQKCNFQLGQGPPEIIQDIRGLESQFDLDNHGFQVVRHLLKTKVFDEDTIKSEYIPEIDMLLKSIEPDISVHVFDWRLRSSSVPNPKLRSIVDLNDPMLVLKPVQAVHVDQSPYAAMKHARIILGDDPDAIMNKRIRIINIWRPIRDTVENWPLAVCDGSTVPRKNLLEVDHVRKYYVGESLYPIHSGGYKWHYLNHQTRDEVILFKIFDSKPNVPAACCPHTSFNKSKALISANTRESIELRAVVISDV